MLSRWSGMHFVGALAGVFACLAIAWMLALAAPLSQASAAEPQQQTDISKLNGSNWMSGISGDYYLHDINIPGTHDSSMTNLGLPGSLSAPFVAMFKDAGHTQSRYIDQQLTDGVRVFDLRLTDESPNPLSKNDGKSTWLCHGPSPASAALSFTCYAEDYKDDYITFDKAMQYFTDFLQKNPTETLIVSVTNESGTGDKESIFRRAKATIGKWISQKNPKTGESYVYTKGIETLITKMPQLKDTRGKIVFISDNASMLGYGMQFRTPNNWGTTTMGDVNFAYENHYDTDNETKFKYVQALYNGGTVNNTTMKAQKGTVSRTVSKTKRDHGIFTFTTSNKFGKGGWWPKSISEYVNPRVFTNKDALMNTRGVFYGWVNVDYMTADIAKTIWMNNFPAEGLEYATVKFDANGGAGTMDSIKVQKGGTAELPKCTMKPPAGKLFMGWKVDGKQETHPDKGSVVADGDVTLKAQWGLGWRDVQKAIKDAPDNASTPTVIELNGKLEAGPNYDCLVVPAGKNITIKLNGNTVDRGLEYLASLGNVFKVEGKLTIEGPGTLTGGRAYKGGGVYVAKTGSLTLKDVTIKGNSAEEGGAVLVEGAGSGGGAQAGKLVVSGNTVITDNRGADRDSRQMAGELSNVKLGQGAVIEVADALSADAKIGFSTVAKPSVGTPVVVTNDIRNKAELSQFMNEGKYAAAQDNEGKVVLKALHRVAFVSDNSSTASLQLVETGGKATRPANPTKDGYTFADWYKDGKPYDFETAVTEDITLRAKWGDNNTVTFDSDGGSEVAAQHVANGAKAKKPANPTKDGYTFKYWADASSVSGGSSGSKAIAYDFDSPVYGDLKLKAVWQANGTSPDTQTYNVTFSVDEGSPVTETQQVSSGGFATKPTSNPTKTNYSFGGWFAEAQKISSENASKINSDPDLSQRYWVVERDSGHYLRYLFSFDKQPITEDTTLYARWISNSETHAVTFDANAGSDTVSGMPGQASVPHGQETSEPTPDPTRDHYHFTGWYTDQECTKLYDFATPVVANLTLYAGWQPMEYIVSFATGTDQELDDQVVAYGKKATKPADPSFPGFKFTGWYPANGTAAYNFNDPVTNDIALYAMWEEDTPATCKVTFDALGASPVPEAQTVAYGASASEPATAPTRDGYTFDGWYVQAEGVLSDEKAETYRSDTELSREYWVTDDNHLRYPFEFGLETVTQDTTLYARWMPKENTVIFVDDAGETVMEQLVNTGDTALEPDGFSSSAKEFAGWYADESRTTSFDFSTPITKDTTIYGKRADAFYTVTFDSNGGSAVTPQTQQVVFEGLAQKPNDPVWEGHVFKGWYEDFSDVFTPEGLETVKQDYVAEYEEQYPDDGSEDYVSADEVRAYLDESFIVHDGKVYAAYDPETDPVYSDMTVRALWTEGSLETNVVIGEGAPHIEALNLDAVALGIVSDEEISRGAHVWLEVKALEDADVPAEDKLHLGAHVRNLGAQSDMWLDISLYKEVGGEVTQVHETTPALELALTIPESLRTSGTLPTRTFYLARVHEEEASTVLEGVGEVINGTSDKFSTYVLAHKDAGAAAASATKTKASSASGKSVAKTGDTTAAALLICGVGIAALAACVLALLRRKA